MNKEMKKMARWGAKNMPEPDRGRRIWGMKQGERTIPGIEKHGPSCIDGGGGMWGGGTRDDECMNTGGGDPFVMAVSAFHRIVAKSLQIVKRFGGSVDWAIKKGC